ncbi:hypothetical protein GGI42DRAFT_310799 [Trichoderma sp. SZMC 28013]
MPAPFSNSSFTTASCPLPAARDSAVRPALSFTITSAPFSRSNFTIASCPWLAAQCSAVLPLTN